MSNRANEHMLVFINSADNAAMFPIRTFLGATCAADSTVLLNFTNSLGPNASEDKRSFVTLTTTADKEKDVMIGIADAINQAAKYPKSAKNYTVVCDDVNSVFAHADIVSCTITLDA
tara:strand:- start:140 stop:490 length:351 start_codon:yes stop_codon:yes gene_type:complete